MTTAVAIIIIKVGITTKTQEILEALEVKNMSDSEGWWISFHIKVWN